MSGLTQALAEAKPSRHAQERTLERLKISTGQVLELIEAGAYVDFEMPSPVANRRCLVAYSLLDKKHITIWTTQKKTVVVTVMPFHYQLELVRKAKDGKFIQRSLRTAHARAVYFNLGPTTLPATSAPPPPSNFSTSDKSKRVIRLWGKVPGAVPFIELALLPSDYTKFGFDEVYTSAQLFKKLQELAELTEFIAFLDTALEAEGKKLTELLDLRAQLVVDGIYTGLLCC